MVPLPRTMSPTRTWGLQVRDLAIRKGRTTILTDFTWELCPGEVAWIMGENGAGKSSLLRILAGRDRPAAGAVTRHAPPGIEPTTLYFHPGMSLPDSLTVGAWLDFVERIIPPATRYPLEPELLPPSALSHKRVENLSTGEAKRLALHALLLRAAPFLILDEPFEHLSPGAKGSLAAHLRARARDTIIIVATNQEIPRDTIGPILSYYGDRLELTRVLEWS